MTITTPDIEVVDMTDFNVAIPCEMDFHEFMNHKGSAEWVMRISAKGLCHCESASTLLVCNECCEVAKTHDNIMITCGCGCTDIAPFRRVIVSIEPINKKPD